VTGVTGDMKPQTGHDVVDALLYAAHRVRNAADARLRERGLSLQGYKLMRSLENSDLSMREISDVLYVSPRTVTDMIDGLEAKGLVARHAHPADRRVTLVHLTDAGRQQLSAATAGAERNARAAVSALSEADQQTLRRLLDQIAPDDPGARTAETPKQSASVDA
jgi:DNA-binding MarR family transcriptional regulator